MFGIGFWECVVVVVVALVVFSPQQLPELFETLGKWVRGVQQLVQDVKKHEF